MTTGPLHIVAVGARTPLGMTADATAAAARAGMTRVREHPVFLDRKSNPIRAGLDPILDPTLTGPMRLVPLLLSSLAEVARTLEDRGYSGKHIPLMVALPEFRPGWTPVDSETIKESIQQKFGRNVTFGPIEMFCWGHAAGLSALEVAGQRIARGSTDLFVIAGVDSYLDCATLSWLDETRQLATSYHRSAFFPGEAAAAFAITNEEAVYRYEFTSLAIVRGVATALETKRIKSGQTCLGEGLTECVRKAVRNLRVTGQIVEGIFCDINGERYRSEEWGFTLLRLGETMRDPTDYELSASAWGDVGAASGPLYVTMAVAAGRRGYSKGSRYLIWNSSENGRRAAMVLELNCQREGVHL